MVNLHSLDNTDTINNITASNISVRQLPGLEDTSTEMRSANYAFIRGPQELVGMRIEDNRTQKIILEWLEKERFKGNRLVGSFSTSTAWLFEIIPNSVRFIKDEI